MFLLFILHDQPMMPWFVPAGFSGSFGAPMPSRANTHFDRALASRATSVHVAVGLVDQIQVQIVQAKPLQRAVKCALRLVVAGIRQPEFRGDKELRSRYVAPLDAFADG